MAYIYQIQNDINGKLYIGKTEFSIEKRFKEHCKDAFRDRNEKRPLYAAMRKYGIEHFHISLIEETDNPEEREKFWIEYFGTFKNGYNATMGGDGKKYIDYDLVVAIYHQILNQNEVARRLNISSTSVNHILKLKKIPTLNKYDASKLAISKIVNQYDLNGNYLNSFPSAREAAQALDKITTTSNGASSHITDVCSGKRKTAYGYIWKFDNGRASFSDGRRTQK